MALIKSQVLTQASGSVGGLTYSHTAGGMYMRARSIPVNPNTGNQLDVRAAMTALVTAWTETLSAAQRATWDLYGANTPTTNPLGEQIFLSGQNWYIACNTPRLQAQTKLGGAPAIARVDSAPIIFDRGTFTTPTFGATQDVELETSFTNTDAWAGEVGSILLIYEGQPKNPSRNFFNGPYRLIGVVRGAVIPPTSPVAITAATIASLGYTFAQDQNLWVAYAVSRADGRLSTRRVVGPNIVTV